MDNLRLERRAQHCSDFQQTSCKRKSNSTPRLPFDVAYAVARAVIFTQALSITRAKAAAEDVVQDVFLYAWMNAEKYDEARSSVLTWLTMLCKSRSIDYLRAHAIEQRIEIFDTDVSRFESTTLSPELSYEIGNRRRALTAALNLLEPLPRQAIVLSYFGELTHNEIAAQMHIPLGTVKTLIRRARCKRKASAV